MASLAPAAIGTLLSALASIRDPKTKLLAEVLQGTVMELTEIRAELRELLTIMKSIQQRLT